MYHVYVRKILFCFAYFFNYIKDSTGKMVKELTLSVDHVENVAFLCFMVSCIIKVINDCPAKKVTCNY